MGNYATEEDKSLHLNDPNQDNADAYPPGDSRAHQISIWE